MTKAKTQVKPALPVKSSKPVRPARGDDELARMRVAHARREKRHDPVSVDATREPDGRLGLEAPHDDGRGWLIRLGDAVGTRSDPFALGQLNHLVAMLRPEDQAPETMLNAMLAGVDAVRPENEAEGALAVQMAATHHFAMACLSRAACATTIPQAEAHGTLATKMLRTYTTQLEALAKLRRGGAQKVTVEHVHVYQGGQAIVGNVATGGGGAQLENGQQSHAPLDPRSLAFAPVSSVLRDDAGRDRMPVTRGEGEGSMPDAWRRERDRSSEG